MEPKNKIKTIASALSDNDLIKFYNNNRTIRMKELLNIREEPAKKGLPFNTVDK